MAEYTYDNILIDPSKQGIESLIGKEVYCHENPYLCLKNANKKSTDFLGVLMKIHKDSNNPFCVKQNDGVYKYPCIIEKKEEPKPKPKYVPFKNITEFLDAYRNAPGCLNEESYFLSNHGMWLKDKDRKGAYFMVTEIWNEGVVVSDIKMKTTKEGNNEYYTTNENTEWKELLRDYTFLDGSPCGKEVK